MQRLGFLKYLVSKASNQRSTTASFIGGNLLRTASQKFSILVQSEIADYCNKIFSEQHYSSLRSQLQKAFFQQPQGQIDLELQDIYLSQDIMPSKRGRILAEKEKDIHIFPALAVSLGFFSPDTYMLTSRGRLFANMISSAEIDAFNRISNINPMIVSFKQTLILLFSFLEADGALIKILYPAIIQKENEFTDYEIGDIIGELLDDYLVRVEKLAVSMKDKVEISKLKKTNQKIKEWKGKKYVGVGARDEWATLRLEPFVDMGLLSKPDKFAYRYNFTDGGRRFVFELKSSNTLDEFLLDKYVSSSAEIFNIQASPITDSNRALESLKESNRLLANNIGYSDIIDTALLSAVSLLQEGKYLEISDSIKILKEAQKNNPYNIHFNIDRWGNLKFISFRKL
jgi:hypothetical protein